MSESPKRRWPRYSLRTLFVVVTVFAVWLGWGLHWSRSRAEFRLYLKSLPAKGIPVFTNEPKNLATRKPWKKLPITLYLLGEEPVGEFVLPATYFTQSDCEYIDSLFPETNVVLRHN